MSSHYALEISVESVEAAAAAERGGADRIELCSETAVGGLTPGESLMEATRARVKIPIFAMIRPRAGNFVYSPEEFQTMRASIELAKRTRMDGVVLGLLTKERHVDVVRTRELVDVCKGLGMEVTFHRAIDEAADLLEALERIIQTGADRILTSGGKPTAQDGADLIAELVKKSRGRVRILPGAGISAENVQEVARRTGAREFHSGLSSVLGRGADAANFEAEVRRLKRNLSDGVPQAGLGS
jgi:copper homeostasis protein